MIGRLFSFEISAHLSFASSERFKMLFMENGLSKTGCACGRTSRPKDAIVGWCFWAVGWCEKQHFRPPKGLHN